MYEDIFHNLETSEFDFYEELTDTENVDLQFDMAGNDFEIIEDEEENTREFEEFECPEDCMGYIYD